jgi:hypothetical protein
MKTDSRSVSAWLSPQPLWLVVVLAALALLAMPAAAQAKQARLFAGTFGAASNPAPFPANPYPLQGPAHLAVDATSHDVYVTDPSQSRIEKFDSAGNFLYVLGPEVNKTAVEEARPTAEQNLCPAPGQPADVCQVGQNLGNHSPLEEPASIALDNAPGPGQGDFYLANGANAAAGLIEKFDPAGHLVETWGASGVLDGFTATDPAGPFEPIAGGIATDPAGHLWVNAGVKAESEDKNFEFDRNGAPIGGFEESGGEPAADAAGNLYLRRGPIVGKFGATGTPLGDVAPSKAEYEAVKHGEAEAVFSARGIAVDGATNDLYVDGAEGHFPNDYGAIRRYDSTCKPVFSFESPMPGCEPAEIFAAHLISDFPSGIAIDSANKSIYVADHEHVAVFATLTVPDATTTKPASPTHTSATLTGTVNPAGIELNPGLEGCRFEWGLFGNPYEHQAPCDKSTAEIGTANSPVEVAAPISGLQAGARYHYRLVASNKNDVNESIDEPSLGADLAFGPPLIQSASALGVTANEATLQAEVDPDSIATRVRIEYGTQAGAYDHATEELDFGSAGAVQAKSFELTGLAPVTTYHYRAVAENVLGEGPEAVLGEDLSFTTQPTGTIGLPDDRQWQLVSPPDKQGARLEPLNEANNIQAAADGGAIAYTSNAPTELLPEGYLSGQNQVLSRRTSSGWSSRDLGVPHPGVTGTTIGHGIEVKFFSSDLSAALIEPWGSFNPAITPAASQSTPFLRDLSGSCSGPCYRPLVSACPVSGECPAAVAAAANVPPGTDFGGDSNCEPSPDRTVNKGVICGPTFVAATEDLTHVLLSSSGLGLSGPEPEGIYEWFAGALTRVTALPNGEFISGRLGGGAVPSMISADGSRVAWSVSTVGKEALYLRANATAPQSASGACDEAGAACTIQLDAKELGCGSCESGGGTFQHASRDGSRVFFTDTHSLTADSGAGTGPPAKADLYECRIVEVGEKLKCALVDLTPETGGEAANVRGSILGASADGSRVYFVANGALAENTAENGAGPQHAQPGKPNLYLAYEGALTFIATLADEDATDWGQQPSVQPTRVSPDGNWLELMSAAPLTGYDNRDLATGKPVAEVYLYDAQSGKLSCASCNPTSARPRGFEYVHLQPGYNGGLVGGPRGTWGLDSLVAATVPGWTTIGGGWLHQDRYLSNSGRLFFNAGDDLAPLDSNGTFDVYQYEPPGVGDCATSLPIYSPQAVGCVSLISSGTSAGESAFLDASETGDDVFFLTRSRLAPQDLDAALDVYDAHSCASAQGCLRAPPAPPPTCQGDACQAPAQAPNDATPGSLSFDGPGNAKECPKGKKLQKGECVAKKHKSKKKSKKPHQKQKRSAGHGRGGSK